MVEKTAPSHAPPKTHFVSIGMVLAIGFWILEAFLDSLLIENASFMMRLLPADSNELWMRCLVSVMFLGFGLYAHRTHVRIRAARELNVDAAWLLKNALSNTIRGDFAFCTNCKNICDEEGQWVEPDRFICDRTEAKLLRIVCHKCQAENR